MSVTTCHPQYTQHAREWQIMRDALDDLVKWRGAVYLPMTDGMQHLSDQNKALADAIYKSYKDRAIYPLWVKDAIRSMMGLVSRVNLTIELPSRIEYMRENATSDGFGLEQLFMRTVRELLITGRRPLMTDIDGEGRAYVALYDAESAINWKTTDQEGRQDLSLVVFAESRDTSVDEFDHDYDLVYRVLRIVDGRLLVSVVDDTNTPIDEGEVEPSDGRGQRLGYIPVVFCGSTDNSPNVDEVPLLTMAKSAIKYYQLSADYYESLHKTAHPQAWAATEADVKFETTGPATIWHLGSPNGSVGYLEITGTGIEATAKAMDEQRNAALEAGARVMDAGGTESGEARKARQNDQTATLSSIVTTAASAIQQSLEYAAEMIGADPGEVSFQVDPDFALNVLDAQMLTSLQNAALAGLISSATYWTYVSTGKIPERTWDEEVEYIESQPPGSSMSA